MIAILLRVGVHGENAVQVGQQLLQKFGGSGGLHGAPFDELVNQHGFREAKAAQIKAAIELGRRLTLESTQEPPTINNPADTAALVQYEISALEQEHLRVSSNNARHHVLEFVEVYGGPLNTSHLGLGGILQSRDSTQCHRADLGAKLSRRRPDSECG